MGALPAITVLVPGGYAHTLGDAQAMRHAADLLEAIDAGDLGRAAQADGLTTAEHVMTAADREKRARKFARLWATGASVRQVAKRYGVHHQTVLDDLRWLDHWPYDGLKPYRRRRVPARDKRMAEAAGLRADGLSLRQIAERLSCSHQTISNDLAPVGCRASAARRQRDPAGPESVKKWRLKVAPTGARCHATF